jgi:hypothetical protein
MKNWSAGSGKTSRRDQCKELTGPANRASFAIFFEAIDPSAVWLALIVASFIETFYPVCSPD